MEIQRHPVKSKFCKLRLLCRTLAGNNVYYLTVTAPSGNEDHMRVGCQPSDLSLTELTHSFRGDGRSARNPLWYRHVCTPVRRRRHG